MERRETVVPATRKRPRSAMAGTRVAKQARDRIHRDPRCLLARKPTKREVRGRDGSAEQPAPRACAADGRPVAWLPNQAGQRAPHLTKSELDRPDWKRPCRQATKPTDYLPRWRTAERNRRCTRGRTLRTGPNLRDEPRVATDSNARNKARRNLAQPREGVWRRPPCQPTDKDKAPPTPVARATSPTPSTPRESGGVSTWRKIPCWR